MSDMRHLADGLTFLGWCLPLIAAATVWMSPDFLRWLVMRLRMRVSYIEAGRDAAELERSRFEEVASEQ